MAQGNTVEKRIIVIDALRGFALLGIILVHFNFWFVVSPLPDSILTKDYGKISKLFELIVSNLVKGKFYFLFSFIFGLSFHLLTQVYKKKRENINPYFFRRAVCLFIVGFLHNMFWAGDILIVYAVMMVPIIFIRNLEAKHFLWVGMLFVMDVPNIIREVIHLCGPVQVAPPAGPYNFDLIPLIQHGSISEIIRYNIAHFNEKITFLLLSGRLSITFGFFLVGVAFGKKGWIQDLSFSNKKLYNVFIGSFVMLLVFQLAGVKLNHTTGRYVLLADYIVVFIQNISAMSLYILFVVFMLHNRFLTKGAYYFAYLTQTVLAFILFYGVGCGLFLITTPAQNFVMAVGIIILQMFFSRWWLARYKSGFVEWLLRVATYLEYSKLKK